LILSYCKEHDLESGIQGKAKKRVKKETATTEKKIPSAAQSLALYKEGVSISAIARRRSIAESTVAAHLSEFIQSGELSITDLIDSDKIEPILQVINQGDLTLNEVKAKLGDRYSYSEIRAVMHHRDYLHNTNA
jgi:ATP-dependent DNA helicase RecQ